MNAPSARGEPTRPLGGLARSFINRYQGGFPLFNRPFRVVADDLGTDEKTLIAGIRELLDAGVLSRFGPLFDAERLGGRFTLAAMAVPQDRFDRVAAQLAELPEVAHNYRRGHRLNMWFVLATESESSLRQAIERIAELSALKVHDFPKLAEYHLGFWLHLASDGAVGVRRVERERPTELPQIDERDRALVAATQAGLPLISEPYARIATDLGWQAGEVIERLRRLLADGAIRRIGAVPNHYRLGLKGNGMTVWDIDDAEVDRLGRELGTLDFVSHCYRRPRHRPLWPYNLFAMVHGTDRASVQVLAERVASLLGPHCNGHQILFSEAVLKKTGLRFTS